MSQESTLESLANKYKDKVKFNDGKPKHGTLMALLNLPAAQQCDCGQ
jgi:hypothetical protein